MTTNEIHRRTARRWIAVALSATMAFWARESVAAELQSSGIKITDVQWACIADEYTCSLIRITTDSKHYGIGEGKCKIAPNMLAKDTDALNKVLIGEDPVQVEHLTQKMMATLPRAKGKDLLGVIAGIEIALWDLAGKIQNKPVYQLIGEKRRDRILVYYDTSPAETPKTVDPKPWVAVALKAQKAGWLAIKFDINHAGGNVSEWVKILKEVRSAIGPEMKLAVDFHRKLKPEQTDQFLKEVESINLWFVEEPMGYKGTTAKYKALCEKGKMPIVTMEHVLTTAELQKMIKNKVGTIGEPDAQYIGGLSQMKKFGDMLARHGLGMLPHNMSSPVGTIAQAHVCATLERFVALENSCADGVVKLDGPLYQGGHIVLTDKPGLGIELDEDYCRKHLAKGSTFFGKSPSAR